MTIYEKITQDHETHTDLLNKLAETSGDSKERELLWNRFYYDVKAHAAAEEETFYAKLIETKDGQPDARHSIHEHHKLEKVMEELHEMEFANPAWLKKFKELKHNYLHHMEEEENEVFDKAKQQIGGDTESKIGDKFESRKDDEFELVDKKVETALEH
jgi:hemerythrin superfamily protein